MLRKPLFAGYEPTLLLGSVIYLYLNLFTLTATPFLLGGDQVFYWMYAQRLLHGERIYRDFFQITPPGTDLLYLGGFELFGTRIWVPNLVVLATGVGLCWLCLRVARSIMKPAHAALAAALFTIFFYGHMINGTHHAFSMAAVMGALAVLVAETTAMRLSLAGSLLGIASFFTQTTGLFAAVGIAAWQCWEAFQARASRWSCVKALAALLLPLGLTWAALSGYFIATNGLRQLFYFQVTHVQRYMVSGSDGLSLGFGEALTWFGQPGGRVHLLVYATLPAVYAIALWRGRNGVTGTPAAGIGRRVRLVALVGAALFLQTAQHPSWLRVYFVAIPGAILLTWLLTEEAGRLQKYAAPLLSIALLGIASHQVWARHRQQAALADLPAGRIATTPLDAEKATWFARHTLPGQFFFQAGWPGLYLPLALRNPVFLDELDTSYQTPLEYVELSVGQLEAKRVRYILWLPQLESPEFPFMAVRKLLADRYQRVWTFSDRNEVWERK